GLIKAEDLPTGLPTKGPRPNSSFNTPYISREQSSWKGGAWKMDSKTGRLVHPSGRSFGIGDQVGVIIAKIDLATRRMDLVIADEASRDKGKGRKLYPKRGSANRATPTGPEALGSGGINLDWETLKSGKDGSAARNQKSKSRDRGKKHHRRDK